MIRKGTKKSKLENEEVNGTLSETVKKMGKIKIKKKGKKIKGSLIKNKKEE